MVLSTPHTRMNKFPSYQAQCLSLNFGSPVTEFDLARRSALKLVSTWRTVGGKRENVFATFHRAVAGNVQNGVALVSENMCERSLERPFVGFSQPVVY